MHTETHTPFPILATTASLADVINEYNNLAEFLNQQNFPDADLLTE
jgi:hypothetical protein